MTHFRFHCPRGSLDKIEKLCRETYSSRYLINYLIRYLYVVDYISMGSTYFRKDVPVNRNFLSQILGTKNKATSKILSDLVELDVIEKTQEYKREYLSSRYRIKDKSKKVLSIPFPIKSSKIIMNIIEKRNNRFAEQKKFKDSPEVSLLYSYISNIKVDKKVIYSVVDYPMITSIFYTLPNGGELREEFTKGDIEEFKKDYENLLRIHHGDLYINRPDLESRVYTPFTNLHREHRKFLSYEGKTLKCVDIRNSQPLISAAYIKKFCDEYKVTVPEEELKKYKSACEQGRFYELFMTKKEREGDVNDRAKFKKDFFGSVFFTKKSKRTNRLKEKFIKVFPKIHDILDHIKVRFGNDGFAIKMQQLEASIIWDDVNVSLLKDGYPCYNIYDSIVSHSDEVLEEAKKRIMEAFAKHELTPTLNIEDFTKY